MSIQTTIAAALRRTLPHSGYYEGSSLTTNIADGLEADFIVIPRAELPSVETTLRTGKFITALAQEGYQPQLSADADRQEASPKWSRQIAYANLAVAEAMDARGRRQDERIARRRDELARQCGSSPLGYADTFDSTQRAIDRIILLEDAADQIRAALATGEGEDNAE